MHDLQISQFHPSGVLTVDELVILKQEMTMTRILSAMVLAATIFGATAPAFALDNVANCDAVPKSEWARCIIRHSKEQSSQ